MKALLNKIHPSFKLNGICYNPEELKEVAYSLIKEGLDNEIAIGDFLLDWLSDHDSIEVYTSGSTGVPKAIRIRKEYFISSAKATADYLKLSAGCTALLCLPANYIAGKMMLVRAMVNGLDLYYITPSASPLSAISRKFDFTAMVPMQVENDLEHIEQIATILVGGAAVPQSLKQLLKSKSNAIYETFGMTETVSHIAMRKLSGGKTQENFSTLPEISVSVDAADCLIIEASKLGVHKLVTKDVVQLISDNEFRWLGRLDNVINSGGVKLYAEQLEKKLDTLIDSRFMVAGLADERLGEKLILLIEDVASNGPTLTDIKNSGILQKYEVPKNVFFLEKFMLTNSGKIDRNATLRKTDLTEKG